jgi:alpha-L-fucosidase
VVLPEAEGPRATCNTHESIRRAWLDRVAAGHVAGPFHPDRTSLAQHRAPAWYEDARFGILLGWDIADERTTAAHLEGFDAVAWARLFKEAGARYVVARPECHDGGRLERHDRARLERHDRAAMFEPRMSSCTAVTSGPRRDVLAELRAALLAEELRFGLTSPSIDHEQDGPDGAEDWLARTAELVSRYEPDMVRMGRPIESAFAEETVPRFLAYYYNQGASRGGVVVDHEESWLPPGLASSLQVGIEQLAGSATRLIHLLADAASKNVHLLLEVTPRPDGTIPDQVQSLLRDTGAWLRVNGEAIHASRPWVRHGEGRAVLAPGAHPDGYPKPVAPTPQDFRFTTRDEYLYAIQLGWAGPGEAIIRSILPRFSVREVRLLATGKVIPFSPDEDGLHLLLPRQRRGEHAWVFRIEVGSLSGAL